MIVKMTVTVVTTATILVIRKVRMGTGIPYKAIDSLYRQLCETP